jgi:hypothetical protein
MTLGVSMVILLWYVWYGVFLLVGSRVGVFVIFLCSFSYFSPYGCFTFWF